MDLDMFEQYWIDQFSGLLNVVGNLMPPLIPDW